MKKRGAFFMLKHHSIGIVLALLILAIGFNMQPEKALGAEEHHWGIKKAKDGIPAEAGQSQCIKHIRLKA